MFRCIISWKRAAQYLDYLQIRSLSNSALFVSGRVGTKQFAVVKPKIDTSWLRANLDLLSTVHCNRQTNNINIPDLLRDLDTYSEIKYQMDLLNDSLKTIQETINEKKSSKINCDEDIKVFKETKKQLVNKRDILWNIEEAAVKDFLKLQNCDSKSSLTETPIYSTRKCDKNVT